jgi:hypothetical protein
MDGKIACKKYGMMLPTSRWKYIRNVASHLEPGEAKEDKLKLADVAVDSERQSPLRRQPQIERDVTAHSVVEMRITQMRL